MKYIFPSIVDTLDTLKTYPSLILVFVLMNLLFLSGEIPQAPFVFHVVLVFISLGWYVTGFYVIHQALQGKNIPWTKLPQLIIKYGLILLPILAAFVVITILPFVTLALVYGKWYAANYLSSSLGLTNQEIIVNFLEALFNPYLWIEFFTQNWFMSLLYQLYQVLVLVGILWAKQTGILLVVEKFSVVESVTRGLYYLQEKHNLIVSFIGLRILGNLVAIVLTAIIMSLGILPVVIRLILTSSLLAIIGLVIDTYLVAFYIKADKRSFLQRNIMRWWRSRGKESL